MNDKFYQKFTSEAGFAILAYLDDKLAGAVCCQLLLNNCVYIKFIGTLSRYRRFALIRIWKYENIPQHVLCLAQFSFPNLHV